MYNLGVLLHGSDPEQARQWYERAAQAGDTYAMTALGVLLQDGDPNQASELKNIKLTALRSHLPAPASCGNGSLAPRCRGQRGGRIRA